MRAARGSSRRQQAFFDSVQALPRRLGERGISAYDVANHLPGGEVERAFGRGSHGQGNRTLRTETDALRGRFLARPHSYRLREKVDGDGFLPGFELAAATEAIQAVQTLVLYECGMLTLLSRRQWCRRKYVEGFRAAARIELGQKDFARADSTGNQGLL
jgi:hypothetical protein